MEELGPLNKNIHFFFSFPKIFSIFDFLYLIQRLGPDNKKIRRIFHSEQKFSFFA